MLDVIYNEDCLEGMKRIPDGSVDMILCDLPYGTTALKWDTVIPFAPLWAQYNRVSKKDTAIVLTASQPFTTLLIGSNVENFRYCWVWDKRLVGNPFLAKRQPLKIHEDICVFSVGAHRYNPQMRAGSLRKKGGGRSNLFSKVHKAAVENDLYYPASILTVSNGKRGLHPTQKPVALFEYLIRTYTDPGETVLDNCMGSGTTAIACLNTGRHYIGFEKDAEYCEIAKQRLAKHQEQMTFA